MTAVAKRLGISRRTILTAVKAGALPGLQFGPDNAPVWLEQRAVADWVAGKAVEVGPRFRDLVVAPALLTGQSLPRLLRLADVAMQLGLPRKTLLQAIRRGQLPAYKLGPTQSSPIYTTISNVEHWLQASLMRRRRA